MSWRSILVVWRKEFLENLRDRRTVWAALFFGPLLGPVLFAGMMNFAMNRDEAVQNDPLSIAVAHGERAPNLLRFLNSRGIDVEHHAYDDAAARHAVSTKRHKLVLLVPEDYARRLRDTEPASLFLYVDQSVQLTGRDATRRVRDTLEDYGRSIAQGRLILRGVSPVALAPLVTQTVDVSTPVSRAALVLGLLSYFVILAMLMGGLNLAIDSTAGERERGSLEALLTTPLERAHILYGKILATCSYMLLSLLLTVTACAITSQFIGFERQGMSANLGPGAMLAIVCCVAPLIPAGAGLMTIVASFTRSFREAQSYVSIVIMIPALPLAFVNLLELQRSLPLMAVPSLSQHFLMTSVLRGEWPTATEVVLSAGTSLLLGAVLAWIAGRLYEREAILG